MLAEAHAVYSAMHLPRELAEVLANQGYVALHIGELTAARRALEQAEWMLGRNGMPLDRARVLGGLGNLELRLGNIIDAVERYSVALAVFEQQVSTGRSPGRW